jgi:stage IV sporulation protein FB
MAWSITILRIAGSEVRIHLTFLLLLAWIGLSQYFAYGAAAAVDAVVFLLAVFLCVVLHEFGHALAARRYGINTPDITLLPIGGLARLSRLPDKPSEEIVIALAGPAVNLVIVLVLLVFGAEISMETLFSIENPAPGFIDRLAAVNIFLAVFNLIPAFPMDGGRVLRAALSIPFGRQRATRIAAGVGQAFAFVLGFLGLMSGDAILVFIAIFVYLAAGAEAGQVGLLELANRIPVERAMVARFESLPPNATLQSAAEALLRTTQREFPVVDGGGRLRGFLTRDAMIQAMRATGPETPVLSVMRPAPTVRVGEKLSAALRLMETGQSQLVGVVDADGRLAGYVCHENLGEVLMLNEAEGRYGSRPRTQQSGGFPGGPDQSPLDRGPWSH